MNSGTRFAVQLLSLGTDFIPVSKWLGQSTFTLTLDVYGDFIPEQVGGAPWPVRCHGVRPRADARVEV
jgi:hypothetical protein